MGGCSIESRWSVAETRVVESVEEFLTVCAAEGIVAAAIQHVNEIRPMLHEGGVTVAKVQWATVVGYRKGLVVRAVVDDAPVAIQAALREAGLRTRMRNTNIG